MSSNAGIYSARHRLSRDEEFVDGNRARSNSGGAALENSGGGTWSHLTTASGAYERTYLFWKSAVIGIPEEPRSMLRYPVSSDLYRRM
jgi:hypothetical protein